MLSTKFCRMSECGNTPLEYDYFAFKEETQSVLDAILNEIVALESVENDLFVEAGTTNTKDHKNILEVIGEGVRNIAGLFMNLIKKIRDTLDKLSFEHKTEAQKVEKFIKKYPNQAESINTLWKTGAINIDTCKTFSELDKAFTEAIHKPNADTMLKFWRENTKDFDKINEEFEKSPEKKVSSIYIIREFDNKMVKAEQFTIDSDKAVAKAKNDIDNMMKTLNQDDPADVARAKQMLAIYKELTNYANTLTQLDQKMLNKLSGKIKAMSSKISSIENKNTK